MHPIFKKYDTIIFDCDGVILDSNDLKIEAMRDALYLSDVIPHDIKLCCDYFKNNFGKSRYHHVQYFIDNIIENANEDLYAQVLDIYSIKCEELYLSAKITPGFMEVINNCNAKLYVASGSAEGELRQVFKKRELYHYFQDILGSPTSKSENVRSIIQQNTGKTVMVGDALSDFYAAKENGIEFIAYTPFSNVKEELELLSLTENFTLIEGW